MVPFLLNQAQDRNGQDLLQAMKSAGDVLNDLPFGVHGPECNREDFSRFFCSDLVAAGLEKAGARGEGDASGTTPGTFTRAPIANSKGWRTKKFSVAPP